MNCFYCGNEKSDTENPLVPGCSACDEALTLHANLYHYATTDDEAEHLEFCIEQLCERARMPLEVLEKIQDEAVIEAERMKRREIAYHEFKYGARA